jgi:hypothetical protein
MCVTDVYVEQENILEMGQRSPATACEDSLRVSVFQEHV